MERVFRLVPNDKKGVSVFVVMAFNQAWTGIRSSNASLFSQYSWLAETLLFQMCVFVCVTEIENCHWICKVYFYASSINTKFQNIEIHVNKFYLHAYCICMYYILMYIRYVHIKLYYKCILFKYICVCTHFIYIVSKYRRCYETAGVYSCILCRKDFKWRILHIHTSRSWRAIWTRL